MKPAMSKEAVFDGKQPRLMGARRLARGLFGPVPLIPVSNAVPVSEKRRPGVPALKGEALSIAREMRRRIGREALEEGVVVLPTGLPYTMAIAAKATEQDDSTVTDARLSIVPAGGGQETGLIVHADEPKGISGSSGIELVEDASVMICDPTGDRQYGIADFSPIERPGIRRVVNIALANLAEAPSLRVYPEDEVLVV